MNLPERIIFARLWMEGATHQQIRIETGMDLTAKQMARAAHHLGLSRPFGFRSIAQKRVEDAKRQSQPEPDTWKRGLDGGLSRLLRGPWGTRDD